MEFFRFLPGRKSALAVTAILSGNCGYKRQVFEKEAFPPAPWAEDILLSSRLRRQGKSLIFDPAICALHQPQFSLSEIIKRQYALGRAAAWVRTQIPLRGKIFTQWPYLGIFLPLVNLTTIALELFFSRPAYFFLFILLSPLCLVLNIAWTLGFMRHFFNPQ
jgi:cellulose synthase/poly-beta-1,6-N-acetylglucosamine synthase-like glycosyltransferase